MLFGSHTQVSQKTGHKSVFDSSEIKKYTISGVMKAYLLTRNTLCLTNLCKCKYRHLDHPGDKSGDPLSPLLVVPIHRFFK